MDDCKSYMYIDRAKVNFYFQGEPRGDLMRGPCGVTKRQLRNYRVVIKFKQAVIVKKRGIQTTESEVEISFVQK